MTRRTFVSLLIGVWMENSLIFRLFFFLPIHTIPIRRERALSMPISLDHAQNSQGGARFPDKQTRNFEKRWLLLLFWAAVALLLVAAVLMRLYHLDAPFDRDSYDEGVYWQSLR